MRFKLINRKITFTKRGMMIYTADMLNEESPFENPVKLPKFSSVNQELIKAIVERPKDFEYIENVFPFEVAFNNYYLRVDRDGKPVLKKGKAQIIRTMKIWAKKTKDDDSGELEWVENPMAIVHRILNRHYIPIEIG